MPNAILYCSLNSQVLIFSTGSSTYHSEALGSTTGPVLHLPAQPPCPACSREEQMATLLPLSNHLSLSCLSSCYNWWRSDQS